MKVGLIIMASGLSQRFKSNKLLAQFEGKSLIEHIIEKTDDLAQTQCKRLVLTRTREVEDYCCENGITCILHELPNRNDAIKLGVSNLQDCHAIVFCASDQPLLRKESIEKIVNEYLNNGKGIYRLCHGQKVGNPILFSREYFDELMMLPAKNGGKYLAEKYPQDVRLVQAESELELWDVDTPEDLEKLSQISSKGENF